LVTIEERRGMTEHIKPPTIGGLDGFETWDRTIGAPENKEAKVAYVSVRVGGVIGMNLATWKMWGEPTDCQVMYDPERRRIAFKPVDPSEENSYPLNRSNIGIPCKSLFDYYGVEIKQTRRYHDPKVVDGVLIVDL
jgi:hypothetical protein